MLAISQGTLMKLLEISKKRLFAVCLAVCMVMFHLTHQKKRKKVGKVEGFVHLFALWSSMIKRVLFCQCQYDKTLPGLPVNY